MIVTLCRGVTILILTLHILILVQAKSASDNRTKTTKTVDLEQYVTDLINNLIPANYNKNLRPNYGGEAILVNISIHINDISAISEASMDYKVDFLIRHFWRDHRLAFPVKNNISQVTLGEEFVKKIWLPDSYFANGKELNVHKTVSDDASTLFRITSEGDCLYSTRIALLAQCPMDLSFFPMDQQKCSIEIESYGLLVHEMDLRWAANESIAVQISPRINLPTFQLVGYNKYDTLEDFSTGTYSRVQCDLFLSRSIGYYLSQVYIPALLIVVISWMPFWLDRNDHHARVALGVTTVLTMTTLTSSTGTDFPKISHLKAIDIYLFVAFIMVFLSLIEYATVGYYEYEKSKEHKQRSPKDPNNFRYDADDPKNIKLVQVNPQFKSNNNNLDANKDDESSDVNASKPKSEQSDEPVPHKQRPLIQDTSIIDHWARVVFPATFIAFNIIYIFVLCLLVSIYSSHQEIQVRLK